MGSVTPEEAVADAMQLYDQQGCLHEQFVRQAKAIPEAVAVVTHDGMKVRNCVISFSIYWMMLSAMDAGKQASAPLLIF